MMENRKDLVVLWTSADREVALQMVFMYVLNSKLRNWWENITLIVWGPAEELLSYDVQLQMEMEKVIGSGVKVQACKKCSDNYGVSEKLEELGIEVLYVGEPFTAYIREERYILTF